MGRKGKGKKPASSSGGGDPQASGSSVDQSQQTPPVRGRGQPQQQPISTLSAHAPGALRREQARNLQGPVDVKTVQPASQPADESLARPQPVPGEKGRKHSQQPTSAAVQPRTKFQTLVHSQPEQRTRSIQQTQDQGKQQQQQQRPSPTPVQTAAAPQPSAWSQGRGVWGTGRGTGRGQPLQPAGRGAGRGRGQLGRTDVAPGIAPGQVRQVSETPGTIGGPLLRPQQPPVEVPQAISSKLQEPPVAGVPKKSAEACKWELAIPQRKNLRKGGTCGKKFNVLVNQVALKIDPKFKIASHYDVTITPDKPKRMMRLAWNAFCEKYLQQYKFAFDDVKNAYSPTRLSEDVLGEVTVQEEGFPSKTFAVQVRFAAEVNLRALFDYMETGCRTDVPQKALQCIDIVLRNACAAQRFVRVNRSYFSEPRGQVISLGGGLQLWHGFFLSPNIGWKPFLNVDVTHKGFIESQTVIQLIKNMTRDPNQLCKGEIESVSSFLQGVKVEYKIPNQSIRRKYHVNRLVQPPAAAMFEMDGKPISVLQYFKQHKGYDIRHQNLPCLWVGSREKKVYVPPELCTIPAGQVFNRKLNEIQTTTVIKIANSRTNNESAVAIRKQKTLNLLHDVGFNNNAVVQDFGLTVGSDFEKIDARLLIQPDLQYNNRRVKPRNGVWRAEQFLQAQQLDSWIIVNLDQYIDNNSLDRFVRILKEVAVNHGMRITDPELSFQHMECFDKRSFVNMLELHKQKKLVFVVLPKYPNTTYSKVKQAAELDVGCLTQCIKSQTINRIDPSIVTNILLKVNAKLSGNNHSIVKNILPSCMREPCMIMGADVTHPSPDQKNIPSVAAVTASYNPNAFQYNFSWRLQRREIIDDLENIVREQLNFFYKKNNGQRPNHIIFFRDGVSEGQFQEVMNMEVQAIRNACSKMGTPNTYKPFITFLVVQKRHHTRFFPCEGSSDKDKNDNMLAGTVVDTVVTHPTAVEFYIVSHASIQGVSRPTKYRVLWDDKGMSEDELEALTYYLCYMFCRCTRSVSYPAPTYYAHLAAFRARHYLEGHVVNLDNLNREQANHTIREEMLRGQPMFFV